MIQTGVLAKLWTAGRVATAGAPGPGERLRAPAYAAGRLGVVALVAGLVLAPSWCAFPMDAPRYSDRGGPLTRDVVVHDNSLHPGALATIASPYLHVLATVGTPTRWVPTGDRASGFTWGSSFR